MSNDEIIKLSNKLFDKWALKHEDSVYMTRDLFTLAIQDILPHIKNAFYKGFEKCKNDDANCFTAWREEAPELIKNLLK